MTKTVFRRERETEKNLISEEKKAEEKIGEIQVVSSNGQETARICIKRHIIKILSRSLSSRHCDSDNLWSLTLDVRYITYILKL